MGDMTDDILAECEHEEFQTAVAADPSIVDPIIDTMAMPLREALIDTPEGLLFAHELEGQGERQFYPGGVTVDPPSPAFATITEATVEGEALTGRIVLPEIRIPFFPVSLTLTVMASIERVRRGRCMRCHQRRRLYTLHVVSPLPAWDACSEAVCAECLGIRP